MSLALGTCGCRQRVGGKIINGQLLPRTHVTPSLSDQNNASVCAPYPLVCATIFSRARTKRQLARTLC